MIKNLMQRVAKAKFLALFALLFLTVSNTFAIYARPVFGNPVQARVGDTLTVNVEMKQKGYNISSMQMNIVLPAEVSLIENSLVASEALANQSVTMQNKGTYQLVKILSNADTEVAFSNANDSVPVALFSFKVVADKNKELYNGYIDIENIQGSTTDTVPQLIKMGWSKIGITININTDKLDEKIAEAQKLIGGIAGYPEVAEKLTNEVNDILAILDTTTLQEGVDLLTARATKAIDEGLENSVLVSIANADSCYATTKEPVNDKVHKDLDAALKAAIDNIKEIVASTDPKPTITEILTADTLLAEAVEASWKQYYLDVLVRKIISANNIKTNISHKYIQEALGEAIAKATEEWGYKINPDINHTEYAAATEELNKAIAAALEEVIAWKKAAAALQEEINAANAAIETIDPKHTAILRTLNQAIDAAQAIHDDTINVSRKQLEEAAADIKAAKETAIATEEATIKDEIKAEKGKLLIQLNNTTAYLEHYLAYDVNIDTLKADQDSAQKVYNIEESSIAVRELIKATTTALAAQTTAAFKADTLMSQQDLKAAIAEAKTVAAEIADYTAIAGDLTTAIAKAEGILASKLTDREKSNTRKAAAAELRAVVAEIETQVTNAKVAAEALAAAIDSANTTKAIIVDAEYAEALQNAINAAQAVSDSVKNYPTAEIDATTATLLEAINTNVAADLAKAKADLADAIETANTAKAELADEDNKAIIENAVNAATAVLEQTDPAATAIELTAAAALLDSIAQNTTLADLAVVNEALKALFAEALAYGAEKDSIIKTIENAECAAECKAAVLDELIAELIVADSIINTCFSSITVVAETEALAAKLEASKKAYESFLSDQKQYLADQYADAGLLKLNTEKINKTITSELAEAMVRAEKADMGEDLAEIINARYAMIKAMATTEENIVAYTASKDALIAAIANSKEVKDGMTKAAYIAKVATAIDNAEIVLADSITKTIAEIDAETKTLTETTTKYAATDLKAQKATLKSAITKQTTAANVLTLEASKAAAAEAIAEAQAAYDSENITSKAVKEAQAKLEDAIKTIIAEEKANAIESLQAEITIAEGALDSLQACHTAIAATLQNVIDQAKALTTSATATVPQIVAMIPTLQAAVVQAKYDDTTWNITDEAPEYKEGYYAAGMVTYTRTGNEIAPNNYGTYCLPFDVDANALEETCNGIFVPMGYGIFDTDNATMDMFFKPISMVYVDGIIPAGTPFAVMYNCVESITFENANGVNVPAAPEAIEPLKLEVYNRTAKNNFLTYDAKTTFNWTGALTANTANGLFTIDADGNVSLYASVPAYRGYIYEETVGALKVKNVNITFVYDDKNVTGIETLVKEAKTSNAGIYNLDGKYMGKDASKLNKGIYIINGKKAVK